MRIKPNLSLATDSSAAGLQTSRPAARNSTAVNSGSSAAGPIAEPSSDASRLQGLSEQGGDVLDGAAADQVAGFLRTNMFSQPGMVFAAQSNLNPQTVYNLLQ